MTGLARRELLLGLAAVAVAGVAPAIPIPAETVLTPRAFMLGAPWHFAILPDGTLRISHVSGFAFFNAPKPDGSPTFACSWGEASRASPNLLALERAATFVARHAYLLRTARQHGDAIYLDYTQRDPRDPFADVYTEDAAQLPDIDRYYQIRFQYPDQRGGWFDT